MADKLGVIVPYRNRELHLDLFKKHMIEYLNKKDINYELIIVNQDNAKQFNRGMLLNIGYKYAKRLGCNYLVFHDVDMLPLNVDYSYSEIPLHLATNFLHQPNEKDRETFDQYFGGVTMFPLKTFEKINGYSNKYWAWGYEDDDLLLRCKEYGIELDTLNLKNVGKSGKALYFNGVNSYVKCKNIIDFNSDSSFFISFYPDNLILNHQRESDEFTVFSVPGYDFAICYSSFLRYNFCAFDTSHNALYVNSKIKPNYKTNMCVTFDRSNNIIKVYQDGEFIGQTPNFRKLLFYKKEPHFYLGVGKPDRELIPNFFKGYIDTFAYYDEVLSDDEVKEISNSYEDLREQSKSKSLKTYYDANYIKNYMLTDLSGNDNDGKIYNCPIENYKFGEYTQIQIPKRRKSLFKSLTHEENGFLGNRWKDQATRWNQLRFQNEVFYNRELIKDDGLKDLQFVEHGKTRIGKITEVNVGI